MVRRSVSVTRAIPKIVGVILSRTDLQRAIRMRRPPDFFELRLDALVRYLDEVEAALERLPAPLIFTARDPREGGLNRLSLRARRDLLLRFLPYAALVDIELRSIKSHAAVWRTARKKKIRTIISFHDFRATPSAARLEKIAAAADSLGAAVLKVAMRTDTANQLARLLDFFERHRSQIEIAAMGIGRLGRKSRVLLAERGSVFNYGHIGVAQADGQLSIRVLRRALAGSPEHRHPACAPNPENFRG